MQLLPKELTFVNAILINISVIISTILSYYFVSLHLETKKNRTNLSFVSGVFFSRQTIGTNLVTGLALGVISFVLSINRIPLFGESNGVDMRYVMIFFAVIYGSDVLGIITSVTLIALKYFSYVNAMPAITFNEYFNNLVFTVLLLALCIFMRHKKIPIWPANFLFLFVFMSLRLFLFSFYFAPFFQLRKLTEFAVYLILYSIIFIATTFIINAAVSASQSVHVYRTAAIYDGLTGVYNKESFHFFLDYVANNITKKEAGNLSLAVIDVDNFKQVNDNFGHPVGDLALKHIAKILSQEQIQYRHYICRIGGDEFAIIHNEPPQEAEAFFRQIFKNLEQSPFMFEDTPIHLEISAGLTHFQIDQNFNMEQAFQEADEALYRAKNSGKKQLVVTYSVTNQPAEA
ncbi:diguanylate cyclase [Vagococcus sp. BWB3-3]|uniref:Diguanylate cyclase n=1 Tax=Vagococcus allomyrinae TaxID=2794353 RepID=A0A940PFR9_9ENTE|nr:GGDEF domain-containing protein [Vagococcus allomyrinae]MBP1042726.1 diguanylate cyclase [Vagococcus allomyrinae]